MESLEAGRKRKPAPTGSSPVWAGQGAIQAASPPLLASWGPPVLKPKGKKWARGVAHLPISYASLAVPVLCLCPLPVGSVSPPLAARPYADEVTSRRLSLAARGLISGVAIVPSCPRPHPEHLGLCPSLGLPGSRPCWPLSSQARGLVLAGPPPWRNLSPA